MNSHILILKYLSPIMSRANTKPDEYEEEQSCVIAGNVFYQLKAPILLADVTLEKLPVQNMQAYNNENMIENAEDKISEQPCINSHFKLPQLTL